MGAMGQDSEHQQAKGSTRKRAAGLHEMDVIAKNPTAAGVTFGVSVVVFTLGGYALDRWLDTLPLFLLIGLAIGAIGGFIHLVEKVSPGTLFPKRKISVTTNKKQYQGEEE
jgi:F0F1-type ATP synthase assembly protein I